MNYPYTPNQQFYPQMQNIHNNFVPQQYQKQEIVRVNGQQGAQAYPLAPNSSILMLDENSPIVWLKSSDGAGYATVTPYNITPYQSEPSVDVKSLEERITRLEGIINESNTTSTKSNEKSTKLHE